MTRKPSRHEAKPGSGMTGIGIGIAIPIAIIIGLAVSTYYDAPTTTGEVGDGPPIHWGGHD